MTKNPVSRKNDIVVQELNDEVLIYDLKGNKAFCLNQTSAAIWQMCDGNLSVEDMSRMLGQKLNSPVTEDLVWLAIDQLQKENLLVGDDVSSPFQSVSRREAIKKVGLTAVIALPLISSLSAPPAASAQSRGCNSTSAACTAASNRPAGCCCGNGQQSCLNSCVGTGNGGEKVCT